MPQPTSPRRILTNLDQVIAHRGEAIRLRFAPTGRWRYAVVDSDVESAQARTLGMPQMVAENLQRLALPAAEHAKAERATLIDYALEGQSFGMSHALSAAFFLLPGFQCEVALASDIVGLRWPLGVTPKPPHAFESGA